MRLCDSTWLATITGMSLSQKGGVLLYDEDGHDLSLYENTAGEGCIKMKRLSFLSPTSTLRPGCHSKKHKRPATDENNNRVAKAVRRED
ncbi:unnamed protein product, partial [Mesorhabditis belari]|uniref:Uncharacterized protein n=1 Tax=Mesorhabditis belari TaxID=2138241 RepID=A0AAF3F255_9BILA